MLRNHHQASKWRQSQEQRILDNVKQSLEKRKTMDPQFSAYTFQRFTMSNLGPSALSPNPCRLLMSEFTSLGSAVSPHEITGRRLKSTLIERLRSRSPSIYSFKRQQKQFPQSLTLTPSNCKPGMGLKSTVKDLTLSDLGQDSALAPQQLGGKEMVEELPNIKANPVQDQSKRLNPKSNTSYAATACNAMKSNVSKDIVDLSILGTATNSARERLLMHMSREDIEQEALRNRLLEDAGLRKERKHAPYVKLADRRQNINTHVSGERVRVRHIITADCALARKHREERDNLLVSSSCLVRSINPGSSDAKPILNPPKSTKQLATSMPPRQTGTMTDTKLSNYVSRQSQAELIATYQQASIKLKAELHEKKCKRSDLQNRLRYLQVLASMRLQPDRVPLGFYCYLNLPCCHYSIYSEPHFSIGELCVKCRQRIENCVMIKADIAS
ncbi:Hypothetical protein GSB_152364 [Giardia duodenalis]|nr:Hypothetical protein GL50581_124 [Giardia intestinalis ATCC 50581]ESU44093.1 Hypothetical protein GSB_152364 [Giardia intestinalis]